MRVTVSRKTEEGRRERPSPQSKQKHKRVHLEGSTLGPLSSVGFIPPLYLLGGWVDPITLFFHFFFLESMLYNINLKDEIYGKKVVTRDLLKRISEVGFLWYSTGRGANVNQTYHGC